MAKIADINSSVWGITHIGYGVVLEGVAQIRQCIDVIIRTSKKSDPLRPQFGSDVFLYVDAPANIAVPNVKKAIRESLATWEKRISVQSINHFFSSVDNPVFEITYLLVDEGLIDKVLFDIRNGVTSAGPSQLILQAFFPDNPDGNPYQVFLNINDKDARPIPKIGGFASLSDLFKWVNENWFFYGKWHLLADRLVLYLDSENVRSASLQVETLPIYKYEADFPELLPGEFYKVDFDSTMMLAFLGMPNFNTPGQVLSFAQNNWADAGSFFIEGVQPNGTSVFSDEFSSEFETAPSMKYKLILVNNLSGVTFELNITIA